MRAIILAAGRGSRMKDLTEHQPKCCVPLEGKPLIEWQVGALRRAGIQEVAIVSGYLGNMVEPYADMAFQNPRWAETNMVRSLMQAAEWLETVPCVISYSDIVYHPDHVQALMQAEGDLAITYDELWLNLWEERFENPLQDAETFQKDDSGYLTEIGRRAKSSEEISGQYMGLLKFAPGGWNSVRSLIGALPSLEVDRMDMTGLLSKLVAGGARIMTVPVRGRWCEVDSTKDLDTYTARLHEQRAWNHDWRF